MSLAPVDGHWAGIEHRFPVRVYYEDTDFSGFVYHASYVRFFERGRSEALRAAGISHLDLLAMEPPSGLVVRRMAVEFLTACRLDDVLVVHTRFLSAKGARLRLAQVMERDGASVASVELEIALVTLDGRPRKLPAELAARLAPWLQDARP